MKCVNCRPKRLVEADVIYAGASLCFKCCDKQQELEQEIMRGPFAKVPEVLRDAS